MKQHPAGGNFNKPYLSAPQSREQRGWPTAGAEFQPGRSARIPKAGLIAIAASKEVSPPTLVKSNFNRKHMAGHSRLAALSFGRKKTRFDTPVSDLSI
jgi:hypothetical protein